MISSDAAIDEAHRLEWNLDKAAVNRLLEKARMKTLRMKRIGWKPKLKSEETVQTCERAIGPRSSLSIGSASMCVSRLG